MSWQKIDLSGQDPTAAGRAGDLPADLRGLSAATLADLSGLAGSRADLDATGWWPVTEVDEDLQAPRLVVQEQRVEVPRVLAARQAVMSTAAAVEYARRVRLGCAYDGVIIPIGEEIRLQLTAKTLEAIACSLSLASWPTGFGWRAADNSAYPIATAGDMIAMALAIGAYVSALIVRAGALQDAIAAATTHAGLDVIDIAAGWPATGYPG